MFLVRGIELKQNLSICPSLVLCMKPLFEYYLSPAVPILALQQVWHLSVSCLRPTIVLKPLSTFEPLSGGLILSLVCMRACTLHALPVLAAPPEV